MSSVGEIIAICIVTAIVSGALCYMWMKGRISGAVKEADSTATASEARVDELRKQIDDASRDFDELRTKLSTAETGRSTAVAKAEAAEKNLEEQKQLLADAKEKLSDTFESLAADALNSNAKGFLTLAEQKFKALSNESKTELDTRKAAVEELVKPLNKAIDDYQKESREIEKKRLEEIGSVGEQLRSLALAQTSLQNETAKLVNALRAPQVRGRWGEIALRKTAELAGMSRYCDFVEQESVDTEDGKLRPDMVVKLPADREVVVDSKVPLVGFLEALESETDEERKQALNRHALQMKKHVTQLASKEYSKQFEKAPEFVVMFIPNDTFLAAAAEQDPGLVEHALTLSVVIATPTTFIALLKAIAFGWRQETVAASAQHISKLGQDLSDRLATVSSYLSNLGKSIAKSVEAYNSTIGSFESRVLTSARKFKELGAEGKKEIGELQPIDHIPRQLTISPQVESDDAETDADLPEVT